MLVVGHSASARLLGFWKISLGINERAFAVEKHQSRGKISAICSGPINIIAPARSSARSIPEVPCHPSIKPLHRKKKPPAAGPGGRRPTVVESATRWLNRPVCLDADKARQGTR